MSDLEMQDRQKMIFDKALEVFAERGYYRTTIEEIATGVNLGKGTVYRIIKNKEQLFLNLLQLAASARRETVFENINLIDDLRGKLGRFIICLLRFAHSQPYYFKILTIDVASGHPDFQQKVKLIQGEYQEIILQLLQDGVKQNKFREISPYIASTFLCKLIEGAIRIFEEEPNYSADQIVLSMLDLIWNGFGKK